MYGAGASQTFECYVIVLQYSRYKIIEIPSGNMICQYHTVNNVSLYFFLKLFI